jgi:hypothetical protein
MAPVKAAWRDEAVEKSKDGDEIFEMLEVLSRQRSPEAQMRFPGAETMLNFHMQCGTALRRGHGGGRTTVSIPPSVLCNAGPAILSLPQLEFLFEEIASRADIWISARLCRRVLEDLRGSMSR